MSSRLVSICTRPPILIYLLLIYPGQRDLAANFDLSQSFGFRPESSRPFSVSDGVQSHSEDMPDENMLASLEAMLIQKFDPPTESPIQQFRASSVAKNFHILNRIDLTGILLLNIFSNCSHL